MICCNHIECIDCYVLPCAETISLPVIATADEKLAMIYEFNHANIRVDIETLSGEYIEIPNIFNENYSGTIRFYRQNGTILNDTCYILNTMPTVFTNPTETPQRIEGRFDFVGSPGQTQFTSDSLKTAMIAVSNEKGDLQPGLAKDQYQYDPVTGTVTFNQTIETQHISIKYWKKAV